MTLAGALTSVHVFLADGGNSPADVDPTTGHGPEWGKAGPIGLLTVVLLCVAVYFLVKSLNRNLKKVPQSFDAQPKVAVAAGAASSASAASPGVDDAAPAGTSGTDAVGSPAGPDAPAGGRTSAE